MVNEFSYLKSLPTSISAGASLSPALSLEGFGVVRIVVPAGWDAANLTFQVSDTEGGVFMDLYDSTGNEVVVQAGANRSIVLPTGLFGAGFFFLKVRSGTASVPVPQMGARSLTLLVRPL